MTRENYVDEICALGHKWERHKKSRNAKCYFCNNRKVLCGFNDLGCLYPALLTEWSKNNKKTAHDYIYGSNDSAEWICLNGHTWEARIASRSRGNGCEQCRKEGLSKSEFYLQNFIAKAREKFGDRYDYSKAVWKPKGGKLEIICQLHGSFFQNPYGHLNSSDGCHRCSRMQVSLEEFIARAKECHGDKYDYSRVSFLTTTDKVEIICPDHGIFLQEPAGHMRNHGCKECGLQVGVITFENFLKRAVDEHGDTYIYHEAKWDGAHKTVIECRVHGEFTQNWFNHVKGNGCSKCANTGPSIGEQQLADFVESLGVEIIQSDYSVLGSHEVDILIPSLNLGFEYNGDWWHSDKWINKKLGVTAREYHTQKLTGAASAGVDLYFVWESDWIASRSLIESAVTSIITAAQSNQSPDPFSVKLLGELESPMGLPESDGELLAA